MKIRLKPKPEPNLPLRTFRLRNFKAVRDSGGITFTPLTVFIGNNGSGKSSLIEGLETFQNIVQHGLDEAFLPWRGFEHVWNKAVKHDLKENQIGRQAVTNPMRFEIEARLDEIAFNGDIEIATDNEGNKVLISHEGLNTEVAAPLSAVRPPGQGTPVPGCATWRGEIMSRGGSSSTLNQGRCLSPSHSSGALKKSASPVMARTSRNISSPLPTGTPRFWKGLPRR